MYDIIFVGEKNNNWNSLKERFPTAKHVNDYQSIKNIVFTKMYWLVTDELEVLEDFDFSYKVLPEDMDYIHVFLNDDKYNGLALIPKNRYVSKNEINYRYFTNTKETGISATRVASYDVVFISYNEPNADKNYEELLLIAPHAKRIHGVKGIHNAHIKAAEISTTSMFWVVDGDAVIVNDFDFSYTVPRYEQNMVHVWRSKNPVNGLVYGYGGVKLFPRNLTLNMDMSSTDMTTSISDHFKAYDEISNITDFNTDPFSTWKSAFRECVKLSSKLIDRQVNDESEERLHIWQTKGADSYLGTYCIDGARQGAEYGRKYKGNDEALVKINDFKWLREIFDATYK
jgi:hypothetical protein